MSVLLSLATHLAGCGEARAPETGASEVARQQVDSAMAAYLEAQAMRDGARMNTFYLDGPEFEAVMNGARQDLATTTASNLEYYRGLRDVRGGFTQLRSAVLRPDAVVVSGIRDQTMTDTTGVALRHTGAASWIWVIRDGRWRIAHISSHFVRDTAQ